MQRYAHPAASTAGTHLSNASTDGWCEVRAHHRVIRYRRIGDGPAPMLLVLDRCSSPELWPQLTQGLSASFRVIVPDIASCGEDAEDALRCLLDGLGARGVAVIAAGKYCEVATALARADEEQVGSLVLVSEIQIAPDVGIPHLILNPKVPLGVALPRMQHFLRGGVSAGG